MSVYILNIDEILVSFKYNMEYQIMRETYFEIINSYLMTPYLITLN